MRDAQVALRRELHRHPDLSNQEAATACRVREFLRAFGPNRIVEGIGGSGVAAIYEGQRAGRCVVFRCELDALPIEEPDSLPYRSARPGVSHACGHDGHMAIVAGLAPLLQDDPPARGRVVLLFQPAEETGEGAARVLASPALQGLAPERIYALHNLPGYPLGTVVVRDGVFAAGSRGLVVRLRGITSHAAEPELGRSPALAVSELIRILTEAGSPPGAFATVIHARVGDPAFGVTPGYGEVLATLRSAETDQLRALSERCEEAVRTVSAAHRLSVELEWVEEFPVTRNASACVETVRTAARQASLPLSVPPEPFRWSEDFGHFTHAFESALFGLGSGLDQPALHRPEYDFPDALLAPGTELLHAILRLELG